MARDNSPKVRQLKQLERKQARRTSYDRILIVSEGSKTEPNYFSKIRAAHRLHTASVEVCPSQKGTSPLQVVEYGRTLFEKGDRQKNIQPRAFEKVFAVFDRDEHDSYRAALALAASLDGKLKNDARQLVTFQAIASIPSFELWLLLHFEDIQSPLHRTKVMRRIRLHIPGYEKGAGNVFAITRARLAVASQRAEHLSERFNAFTEPEPFTAVPELVRLLTMLSS